MAKYVRAQRSILGIVFGGKVSIEGSQVMVSSGGAVARGALIGLLLGWLLGRRS